MDDDTKRPRRRAFEAITEKLMDQFEGQVMGIRDPDLPPEDEDENVVRVDFRKRRQRKP